MLVYSTIPLSEAKARLSEIADEVGRTHERVHITRNGREYVVLLAAEDLESLEATLELLADTRAQARIAAAEADSATGEVLDEQQVRALIDERARTRPE
jgi:prevent-host-death family protein